MGRQISALQQELPSRCLSSACANYIPAFCTHRPSLQPIEWLGEGLELALRRRRGPWGLGQGGAKRHRRILLDSIQGSLSSPGRGRRGSQKGRRQAPPQDLVRMHLDQSLSHTQQGRQGSRKGWRQAPPQDLARQHAGEDPIAGKLVKPGH